MTKSDIAFTKSVAKTLRITRRSILFFIRTVILLLLIVFLCVIAFITASRLSNSYILINEGMTLRASSMFQGEDDPDLAVYFTEECISNDAALRSQSKLPFSNYTIYDYEYDLIIDSMHVYPWQAETYADVIEQISAIKASNLSENSLDGTPAWTPIKYRLYLKQIDARWYIDSIDLIEVNPSLPAANTPDPNVSPLPMVTFTPEPTPIVFTIP